MTTHPSPSEEPTTAYLVKYRIVNEAEAIVYADSAAEAREAFAAGESAPGKATGVDYRLGGLRIKRWPMEDR